MVNNSIHTIVKRLGWTVAFCWLLGLWACGGSDGEPMAPPKDGANIASPQPTTLAEGSGTRIVPPSEKLQYAEGSESDNTGHPEIEAGESRQSREVVVPADVDGKWKAVKIMVRNKQDEEQSKMEMVTLGSSFDVAGSQLKVTVGPFLPNFVMTQATFTSNGNELVNPAVRLVVKEGDKTLFEGWAFAKYPGMYAFEHDTWSLQLMDFIPVSTS